MQFYYTLVHFLYRDLVAMNVEISEESIVKISGFGLTREVLQKDTESKLPIRWTAPEALREGVGL